MVSVKTPQVLLFLKYTMRFDAFEARGGKNQNSGNYNSF